MRQWIGLHQGDGRPSLLVGKMVHPPRVETGPYIPASHRQVPGQSCRDAVRGNGACPRD